MASSSAFSSAFVAVPGINAAAGPVLHASSTRQPPVAFSLRGLNGTGATGSQPSHAITFSLLLGAVGVAVATSRSLSRRRQQRQLVASVTGARPQQRGQRGAVQLNAAPSAIGVLGGSAGVMQAGAGIRIAGSGSCAPSTVVSNDDLSRIMETSDEWISQRTGIRRRHILKPDESLGSISVTAAKRALEKAGIAAEDVGLVILATSTPDDMFGSAPQVAAELGARNAVAFDLTAACSGFVFGMVTASQYIRSGAVKNAVIIGADALSRWVDWSDRNTCVLFGDGAGAVVVTATEPENDSLLGFEMGSDGTGACHLTTASKTTAVDLGAGSEGLSNAGYETMTMNGKEVFRFATSRVPEVLTRLLARHEIDVEEVDWLLLHQANRRIMDSAAKRLGLPTEKILCNLDEYGNTSAGSVPLMLDEALRDGRVKPGQLIACMGFGAGLSWGGMLLRV